MSAMVGIEDVLNPEDISIYRALAGGVTTSNTAWQRELDRRQMHGAQNVLGQGRSRHDF